MVCLKPLIKNGKLIDVLLNKITALGIVTFVTLFIYAASQYPGGSIVDVNSVGFDWMNNYWCNLTSLKAINGQTNSARPVAISAMILLCFSLTIFFIQFSKVYPESIYWKWIIKLGGILSMFFASLIFTAFHDSMILISSFFGFFVVIGVMKEIYKTNLIYYKISGAICLLFLLLNNYIYYSKQGILYLPFIQKISFVIVLLWVIGLNYEVGKKI